MKMTPEHFSALKARVDQMRGQFAAHREKLAADPKVKDLEKRFLWDVFHACRMHQIYSYQEFNYLDSHIETAMKKILA